MLKKYLIGTSLLAMFALLNFNTFAQNVEKKWALGLGAGFRDYSGDLGNGFWSLNNSDIVLGLQANRYLNSSFDAAIHLNYGGLGYSNNENNFKGSALDYSLNLKYKFNNGYILKEKAMFAPYILAGAGVLHTFDIETKYLQAPANLTAFDIPLAIGVTANVKEGVSIFGQVAYHVNFTDKYDAYDQGGNDSYLHYQLGLTFTIAKKDTDKDGVPDDIDQCPNTRPNVKVTETGCDLDTDGDGISDYDDACPEVAGVADFAGCPDTDGDGIQDSQDTCPEIAGIADFEGCPDTDGDGIQDSEDKCPKVAGIEKFEGCPDTDGDGIQDSEDKCPKVAGIEKFEGCPDTDGDGIIDNQDKCPEVAGTVENKGCPEINEEVKKQVNLAAKGVFFETGSDKIKDKSLDDVKVLLNILTTDKSLNCEISGHTDNVGNADKNQLLSQSRADALKKYLLENGIEESRISAKGYGDTTPIADNKTSRGRAKNRRVEFKLAY